MPAPAPPFLPLDLPVFAKLSAGKLRPSTLKTRAALADNGWAMVDHACRFCTARVLQNGTTFACSSCDAVAEGSHLGICGCGMQRGQPARTARQAAAIKDRPPAGFYCAPNPNRSGLSPAKIVIMQDGRKEPVR